ncbi:hypothetical protein [Alkalitalea saponilacus]|nr:hypothetical protein [Alkalitalea saponilacus]ASB49719.1 hypothetical protein CDL62_11510 [Alkalitalea saponilacus]
MKNKNLLFLFFLLISMIFLAQEKEIRIGPGPLPVRPEPVVVFDGIKLPSDITKDILSKDNSEIIDSVTIQNDSIYDCNGQLINLGIVRIFTKDSINIGAKKILRLTDNWLYNNTQTKLVINDISVDWDKKTFQRLTSLDPDSILYAKIKQIKKTDCNSTLILKIKE